MYNIIIRYNNDKILQLNIFYDPMFFLIYSKCLYFYQKEL